MNKEVSFYNLTDEETIKKMIGELIQCKEYRLLNKFLKNNNECDKLVSKELNRLYYIEGYKYTKRYNKSCFERNYYKPVYAKHDNEIIGEIISRLSSSKLFNESSVVELIKLSILLLLTILMNILLFHSYY